MKLVSGLRADAVTAKLLPSLLHGLVFGIPVLVYQVSVGIAVFSGPLAPFAAEGVFMALFGGLAVCLVVALMGGYPGAISSTLASSAMVFAAVSTTMAAEGNALFPTMAVTLIFGTVATGMCLLMLGRLGLSNLLRFIPYPVAGGYLAGTGGILCLTALSLMGMAMDQHLLPSLSERDLLWNWVSGVTFGLGIYLVTKRWSNPFILPAGVLIATALFNVGMAHFEISVEQARTAGLLLQSMAEGRCFRFSRSMIWRMWTGRHGHAASQYFGVGRD